MSSLTKSTAIDDLPAEMVCELFKHLHPKDLAACSLVNKRWHSIHAGFKVQRLVAFDGIDCDLDKWCYSDRLISEAELFLCDLEKIYRLANKPLLSNLKCLALCGYSFQLTDKLNEFRQLVQLEIEIGYLNGKKVNLNLPKLKVLAIHQNNYTPLSVDCPELSMLVYREYELNQNMLDLKYPETIRKLDTDMVGLKLTRFKSVECLVTCSVKVISKTTLRSLPGLKELHYNRSIEKAFWLDFHNAIGTLDRMKRTLREFLDDLKLLRGSDFKFTFAGFQLTQTMLDQIDFGVQVGLKETVCDEYVYMKNCQLVDPDGTLDYIHVVNYTSLMSNAPEEIPWCISKKFTGIRRIDATVVQSENHFLGFLKSLSLLRGLFLECPNLSQNFFDQLPTSAHSLRDLYLRGSKENELLLSFNFIGQLSRFQRLYVPGIISFESLVSLVRWLGKLEDSFFDFQTKENKFYIQKEAGSELWKISNGPTLFETKNPEEILSFFERLQSDTPKAD